MATPFNLPVSNPGQAKTVYGQQAYRYLWFDGSYEYAPNRTAWFKNLAVFRRIQGTDEQAPPGRSQDDAHFETAGTSGAHGVKRTFYALTTEGVFVAPPSLLIPVIGRRVEGLADITTEGIIHSHWAGGGGAICLSHWNFGGGYVLNAEQVAQVLYQGEDAKGLLAEIRRCILTTTV